MSNTTSTAPVIDGAAEYAAMTGDRQSVLDRGRSASKLTIPGLIPEEGQNEHSTFDQPYQSLGSRCVAHLSSVSALALFPPGFPFFRLNIDEQTAADMGADLTDANERLAQLSRTAYSLMERAVLRPAMSQVLRHLVVAGNVLLYTPEDKAARIYRIDQYVVKRDAHGDMMKAIVKERVYPSTLDTATQAAIGGEPGKAQEEMVELFTIIVRTDDTVEWWQTVKGVELPQSRGKAPADQSPWLALRWLAVPGSDYGRSHVTEYIGDLLSLEDLYKSMVTFAAVAARIIHIVDPSSGIDVDELAAAESGDFVTGLKDRIQVLQLDKYNDWKVMADLAERLEQRLSAAFLLQTGVMRDAERVTAEEVRIVAQELETGLGGTYTILSAELQLPLVRRFLYIGERLNKLPKLPDVVTPTVVTGFDALGRAQGVNRLRAYVADLQAVLGPEGVAQVLNTSELAKRLGEGSGIEGLADLLKSPEQQAQETQAAQAQGAIQAAAPQIAKVAGEAAAQPENQ